MHNLVFLGAPGSGKGTQADVLVSKFGYQKISTGDLVRAEIRAKSDLGSRISSIVSSGLLVSDEIITELFRQKVLSIQTAFIADGFPRTVTQAQALTQIIGEAKMEMPLVVYFDISEDLLVSRVVNRRICSSCKSVFNVVSAPPLVEGICDQCGKVLIQREDDSEDVVKTRVAIYQSEIQALLSYFGGLVKRLDASEDSEKVAANLLEILK